MNSIFSNSNLMMEKSMDFLWRKQAAILDNISNAETPNYKPKVVTFEESFREKLQNAQRKPAPARSVRNVLENAQFSVEKQQESTRMDENGVNVGEQSVEMIRNAYQLQYVMRSISDDLARIRMAVRGQ